MLYPSLAINDASQKQKEPPMFSRIIRLVAAIALVASLASSLPAFAGADDGVVKLKSVYPMSDTIERLKQDIASKGLMFFAAIDQSGLAADAGISLNPSTLLIFGNPALGTQFITANPNAGLDWPVRLLVSQDANGGVWVAYTDFNWIAERHGISIRNEQFKMASSVIASITSTVTGKDSAPKS